jgi:hypothetical protein
MTNQITLVANVFQHSIASPTPKEEINKEDLTVQYDKCNTILMEVRTQQGHCEEE